MGPNVSFDWCFSLSSERSVCSTIWMARERGFDVNRRLFIFIFIFDTG